MSTAIICIILLCICVFAVRSYMKKLTHGCCGSGGDAPKRVKVQDKREESYPYIKTVTISGMTCKNCKLRVENAFNCREGVFAQVDLKSSTARVLSKEPFSEEDIRELVRKAGYQVEKVEGQ